MISQAWATIASGIPECRNYLQLYKTAPRPRMGRTCERESQARFVSETRLTMTCLGRSVGGPFDQR
jgi:hypothetical protein